MKSDKIFVTIHDKSELIYEGNAISVTSFNEKGKFDVLLEHANFISLIQKKLILRKADGTIEEINFTNGVMLVTQDIVDVYLGVKK